MGTTGSSATSTPRIDWDTLLPGAELSATVLMASGFVLREGQEVHERYRVERRLGEGAMGQVLSVSLIGDAGDQMFALKVVARSNVDAAAGSDGAPDTTEADRQARSFAELLRSEAAKQDFAQRQGVSVARLFALVKLGDGSLGLRMELARGQSLEAQIVRERRAPPKTPDVVTAVRVVRKLLGQLRRLHEMARSDSPFGFVHSDIKPGNVFVDDSDPSELHVTLLDFGVATAGQALQHSLAALHSRRKTLVLDHAGGTLGYVPPFHFTGQVTPLSDVFAALVILYELATLTLPWDKAGFAGSRPTIGEMEDAMRRGPRPVQSVRASISDKAALSLDAFFAKEFGELVDLSAHVSEGLSLQDEDVRRALAERLRGLARHYQTQLDELYDGMAPTQLVRGPRPASFATSSNTTGRTPALSAEGRPTVVLPGRPNDSARSLGTPPAGTTTGATTEGSWSDLAPAEPEAPVVMALTSPPGTGRARDREAWGDSLTSSSPTTGRNARSVPVERPKPGGPGKVIAGVTVLALGGAGIAMYLRSHAHRQDGGPRDTPPAVVAVADAQSADASEADVAAVGADAPPGDAGALLAAGAADAGATEPRGRGDPRGTPARPAGGGDPEPGEHSGHATGQRTRCIAPARDITVVARGGGLARDVVVCRTSGAVPARPWQYSGRGEIPPEVAAGHPSFGCQGGAEAYEISTVTYQSDHGASYLFECGHNSGPPSGGGSGNGVGGAPSGNGESPSSRPTTGTGNSAPSGGTETAPRPPAETTPAPAAPTPAPEPEAPAPRPPAETPAP